MEPTEPIRGRIQSGPSTDRQFVRSWKSLLFLVADYFMCWFALGGLVNAAFGVAAFTVEKINLPLVGQFLTTTAHKLEWIAIYSVASAIGFTYVSWRYHWRYRLSTLFKIAAFCCIVLGALTANAVFAILTAGPLVFVYAVVWACRRKDMPE
jgi:hypothetical protein